MKQFREFKSQQQVVNEIGPVGATIATVMGIVGGAMALKKGLDKFKGYRESQKEKKSNKENGYEIELKTLNPATGKEETIPYFIAVSYTHLTLPTTPTCRSRWSPYH